MKRHDFTYIFAIGTGFAMLDAFNNGASKYSEPFLGGMGTDKS